MVQVSAIGADPAAPSIYGRTKAAGEAGVLAAFPSAVILRPSVIFGPEDGFFNRFGAMARLGPVLPIAGGATRFQPVYVDDVAQAVFNAVTGDAAGVYELGGPEAASFSGLMHRMLAVIQRRRLVLSVPVLAMRPVAFAFDVLQAVTLGLVPNSLITRDQLASLTVDNVVAPGAKGLADLGVKATAMDAVLPEYLWRYRPSGQYAAIKASAKNLKKT
jgi:NADH dehydrogenase